MKMFSKQFQNEHGVETSFVKILYYDFSQAEKGIYRSHTHPRLCVILDGEMKVSINKFKSVLLDSKSMILFPPNSCVAIEMNSNTKIIVLEFTDNLIDTVKTKASIELEDKISCNKQDPIPLPIENYSIILGQINNLMPVDNHQKEFLIDLYVQDMLCRMITTHELKDAFTNCGSQVVRSIIQMMHDGYSLHQIAQTLHVSPSNLSHQFKNNFNLTPTQYCNSLKMTKATELLFSQNVTEVAYDLGFDNISYFIRLFKVHFGVTPKQYQSKYKV